MRTTKAAAALYVISLLVVITLLGTMSGCALLGDSEQLGQVHEFYLESMDALRNGKFGDAIILIKKAQAVPLDKTKYPALFNRLKKYHDLFINLYVTDYLTEAEYHFKNRHFDQCKNCLKMARKYFPAYSKQLLSLEARNLLVWGYNSYITYKSKSTLSNLLVSSLANYKMLFKNKIQRMMSTNINRNKSRVE